MGVHQYPSQEQPCFCLDGYTLHFPDRRDADNVVSSGSKRNQARATTLDFYQAGYNEQSEFFGSNNSAWEQVLQKLKQVVESQRS
jgi:hypothetical protein